MDAVFLIGRILFASLFLVSGLTAHFNRQGVEYARAYNAPAPELLVPASGVAIVLGSLLIGFGIWADVGALLVAGFLLGITPIMHAFWKETEPQQQQIQIAMFSKNVALLGAALIVFWVYNQLQGDAPVSITDPLFGRAD
jgi:putative oxidoreductase